jgi:hypothetical protein
MYAYRTSPGSYAGESIPPAGAPDRATPHGVPSSRTSLKSLTRLCAYRQERHQGRPDTRTDSYPRRAWKTVKFARKRSGGSTGGAVGWWFGFDRIESTDSAFLSSGVANVGFQARFRHVPCVRMPSGRGAVQLATHFIRLGCPGNWGGSAGPGEGWQTGARGRRMLAHLPGRLASRTLSTANKLVVYGVRVRFCCSHRSSSEVTRTGVLAKSQRKSVTSCHRRSCLPHAWCLLSPRGVDTWRHLHILQT